MTAAPLRMPSIGLPRLRPPFTPPARPVSLKRALMTRIVAVALLSVLVVMVAAVIEARLERSRLEDETALRVARHIGLQQLRVESDLAMPERFPDWDIVVSHLTANGQCVRFEDGNGRMIRNACVGSVATLDRPPQWFGRLHALLMPPDAPAIRPVVHKQRRYGSVVVSTERGAAATAAWRALRRTTGVTAAAALSLCLLGWLAIGRALRPTRAVVAGLDRLAAGAFSHRLPAFRHAELNRIGEVANQLAETIEATLGERARLSQRLVNAQEEERRRLARELHDEFAQNLTAIGALAASLERSAAAADEGIRAEARSLSMIAGRMMTSLRGTLQHLRPAELDQVGLAESLRQLIALWRRSGGGRTRFELELAEDLGPLSEDVSTHLYRIAQEGLTNAVRHADAGRVKLRLARLRLPSGRPGIALTVEDDGAGGRELAGDGQGLLNMRERVSALDGSFDLKRSDDAGLRVRVTIPLDAGGEAAG